MRNAFAGDSSGFRYNPCDFYFSLSNFSAVPLFDPSMRKAVLLYNPLSGRRHVRRLADVEAALIVLRQGGVEATLEPTRGQASQPPAMAPCTTFCRAWLAAMQP